MDTYTSIYAYEYTFQIYSMHAIECKCRRRLTQTQSTDDDGGDDDDCESIQLKWTHRWCGGCAQQFANESETVYLNKNNKNENEIHPSMPNTQHWIYFCNVV